MREKIGPVAAFKLVTVVDRLPKTRSGKILRATMVKIADNEPYKMPATIDDPTILDEIKDQPPNPRLRWRWRGHFVDSDRRSLARGYAARISDRDGLQGMGYAKG